MKLNDENRRDIAAYKASGYVCKDRNRAKRDGDKTIMPGYKPNPHCGHVAPRYTRNDACIKCGSGAGVKASILRKFDKSELYLNMTEAHGLMERAIPLLKVLGVDAASILALEMENEILKKGKK